jgi:hypothetical protein
LNAGVATANTWERNKRGLIDYGPVAGELRTSTRYKAFVRERAKVKYRAEWYPGEEAPF